MSSLFALPPRCYFGSGSLKYLSIQLNECGTKKVFLISDKGVLAAGLVEKILKEVNKTGLNIALFTDTKPEPSLDDVNKCYEVFKKENCDMVVGLGGGSVLDMAKAISVLATNGGSIDDYLGNDMLKKKGVPLFLIPTTSGTGSEVTPIAVFTDTKNNMKKGLVNKHLLPEVAIVDSTLTLTLPKHITAFTGMDALTHAIEAYTSQNASIHTDIYALKAIELIYANLEQAVKSGEDLQSRENMSFGSVFAGVALGNAGVGAVHAIAYPLGAKYKMAHGMTNAMLLPYVMKYNLSGNLDKFANISKTMFGDTEGKPIKEQALLSINAVKKLSDAIDIPTTLIEFGVKNSDIPALAKEALNVTRLMDNNPTKLTTTEIESILYEMLN